jgi:hypothetical protein
MIVRQTNVGPFKTHDMGPHKPKSKEFGNDPFLVLKQYRVSETQAASGF